MKTVLTGDAMNALVLAFDVLPQVLVRGLTVEGSDGQFKVRIATYGQGTLTYKVRFRGDQKTLGPCALVYESVRGKRNRVFCVHEGEGRRLRQQVEPCYLGVIEALFKTRL